MKSACLPATEGNIERRPGMQLLAASCFWECKRERESPRPYYCSCLSFQNACRLLCTVLFGVRSSSGEKWRILGLVPDERKLPVPEGRRERKLPVWRVHSVVKTILI